MSVLAVPRRYATGSWAFSEDNASLATHVRDALDTTIDLTRPWAIQAVAQQAADWAPRGRDQRSPSRASPSGNRRRWNSPTRGAVRVMPGHWCSQLPGVPVRRSAGSRYKHGHPRDAWRAGGPVRLRFSSAEVMDEDGHITPHSAAKPVPGTRRSPSPQVTGLAGSAGAVKSHECLDTAFEPCWNQAPAEI